MKNLIVASTSTIYGDSYLGYLKQEITRLFKDATTVLFIPYARPGGITYDEYTAKAAHVFEEFGKKLVGIHTYANPKDAILKAEGIFTGGGNTFVLLKTLYQHDLLAVLREQIFQGLPYLGTSAGSNICGISINTTNDMPIVYPPSFKAMGVLPFNINPHYLDPIPNSKHMGETRETRIKEFHSQSSIPVVGLREGSWIRVNGERCILKGAHTARIFQQEKEPFELPTESEISFH